MHTILKPIRKLSLLFFIFLMLSLTAYGKDNRRYYSDGSLKSIGNISKTGEKQNKWQYFYNNGIKMSEGEFLNGKESGKWTYWNKDGGIIATKNFGDGVKNSTVKKEASPETAPTKKEASPEAAPTHEVKTTEQYIENKSGFAATMEEWKAMKIRKQQMPEVEASAETSTEEAQAKTVEPVPETTPEPAHDPTPVPEQEVEISEPVQTAPIKAVEIQPIAEVIEPAETKVETAKEQAPIVKKKPVSSGGKFWRN